MARKKQIKSLEIASTHNMILNEPAIKPSKSTIEKYREEIIKVIVLSKFKNNQVMKKVYYYYEICGDDLFEKHKREIHELAINTDVTHFDKDYYEHVLKQLTKNFSYFRLMYLREIAAQLYGV